ncbi:MAG: MBL fold metallo-hydrolase [Victivallales bacterium]|nr:MBL fold metallo-hydrolase [Victivallales bacterium]
MVELHIIVLNFLSVNCYVLNNKGSDRALIVDPGSSKDMIFKRIDELGLKPEGILLTHAHVDHISAVPEVAEKYGIPVWIHNDDIPLYNSPDNALKPWMDAVQSLPQPVKDCPKAGMEFSVIHTPGHSRGSCCFYFPEDKFLISGDTLFEGTYGRTDFPGGSEIEIMDSICNKLLTLPNDVTVYPGHGGSTTIAVEIHNPLFN